MGTWIACLAIRLVALSLGMGLVLLDASCEANNPQAFACVQLEMQDSVCLR